MMRWWATLNEKVWESLFKRRSEIALIKIRQSGKHLKVSGRRKRMHTPFSFLKNVVVCPGWL